MIACWSVNSHIREDRFTRLPADFATKSGKTEPGNTESGFTNPVRVFNRTEFDRTVSGKTELYNTESDKTLSGKTEFYKTEPGKTESGYS